MNDPHDKPVLNILEIVVFIVCLIITPIAIISCIDESARYKKLLLDQREDKIIDSYMIKYNIPRDKAEAWYILDRDVPNHTHRGNNYNVTIKGGQQ